MERLTVLAAGLYSAEEIYRFLAPDYESTLKVSPNDPRLVVETITYSSPDGGGLISGQLARPAKADTKWPGVLVVHENRGLNPYIADVGRRLALEGYMTLAPDALSPLGGYPGNDDEGRALQKQRDRDEMLNDFMNGADYLRKHELCTGKTGVVGFCFGGYISNMMAALDPKLFAAVPYYGGQTPPDMVAQIEAPLLLHYAELDERVNAGWPEYQKVLLDHNKSFEAYFYKGAKHGFHNNTTPRHDEEAAKLSWNRTLEFFEKYLQ